MGRWRGNLATFSQVQVLDLTATDPDLTGFQGGFASGGYGYLVPYNNFDMSEKYIPGKIDDAYFGKVVRIDLTQGSLPFMTRLKITILPNLPSFAPPNLCPESPHPPPLAPSLPPSLLGSGVWFRL